MLSNNCLVNCLIVSTSIIGVLQNFIRRLVIIFRTQLVFACNSSKSKGTVYAIVYLLVHNTTDQTPEKP